MTSNDLEFWCEAASKLGFGSPYMYQNNVKIIASLISVIIVPVFIYKKAVWIHSEIHILIFVKLIAVWIYALDSFVTHIAVVFSRVISERPCDYVYHSFTCLSFKLTQFVMFFSMSTTMFCIMSERIFALSNEKGRTFSNFAHAVLVLLKLFMIVVIFVVGYVTEWHTNVYILHCLETTNSIFWLENLLSTAGMVFDGLTLMTTVFVWHRTRVLSKRTHKSLAFSYSVRYTVTMLHGFLPVLVVHLGFLFYSNVAIILTPKLLVSVTEISEKKNFHGFLNIMPYYAVVMPLLYVKVLQTLRRKRSEEFRWIQAPTLRGRHVSATQLYSNFLWKQWNADAPSIKAGRTLRISPRPHAEYSVNSARGGRAERYDSIGQMKE